MERRRRNEEKGVESIGYRRKRGCLCLFVWGRRSPIGIRERQLTRPYLADGGTASLAVCAASAPASAEPGAYRRCGAAVSLSLCPVDRSTNCLPARLRTQTQTVQFTLHLDGDNFPPSPNRASLPKPPHNSNPAIGSCDPSTPTPEIRKNAFGPSLLRPVPIHIPPNQGPRPSAASLATLARLVVKQSVPRLNLAALGRN